MQEPALNDIQQMSSSRYFKEEKKQKKLQNEQFLTQLISTEQNFQVFKYQDSNQQDISNYNTGQSFYKSHSSQFGGLVRVKPQNIQNSDLLSNIYLLSQSVCNQKRSRQNKTQLRQLGAQNSIQYQNSFSQNENLKNGNLNATQNSVNYQINIPKQQKCNTGNLKKQNSNIIDNSRPYNGKTLLKKISSQQVLYDLDNQYQLPKNKFFSTNQFQNQVLHLNNTTKNITKGFKENREGNQNYFYLPLSQRTEEDELPHLEIFKRDSNFSNSVEARTNYDKFLNSEYLFKKDQKNLIPKDEIQNQILETADAQKDFNTIMKSLRYGKIQQHKHRIFREMKREELNSNVFQFHQSDLDNQKEQNNRQQSKSPFSNNPKSLRSSMETFYTTKQDNQELKNKQISVEGENILRQTILQKKKQQYKQDCYDQRFQNFFKRQVTLNKILQPKTLTNQLSPNVSSKESLSQIQMISKQLNGKNPEIYNPFNSSYYKQKHIFSIKLQDQQNQQQQQQYEDKEEDQTNCDQEGIYSNKEILKEIQLENEILSNKNDKKQISPSETLTGPFNFQNKTMKEEKEQNNNNQEIAKILCKYINENRDFLSSEPDTQIKKTKGKIRSPINLDSYKLLQKFLPNFNSVERHFAYNQHNLDRNKLILEKVLLERMVKNIDDGNTQQLDKKLNKKSEFLQQRISKNLQTNKNLQYLPK